MPTTSYTFTNSANYTNSNTEVVGGSASLTTTTQAYNYPVLFTSDAGMTYDSSKLEFASSVARQKDHRPANSIFGSTFTSSLNSSWNSSTSTLSATNIGTPLNTGGRLICTGGNNGIYYEDPSIGNIDSTGTVKFKYIPSYSGSPASVIGVIYLGNPASLGGANTVILSHTPYGGTWRVTARDNSNVSIFSTQIIGAAWTSVAGQTYEIELVLNTTSTGIHLFIDGVLHGTLATTFTRGTTATRMYIGSNPTYLAALSDFDDVITFSDAQHTSGYTPGYSISEYSYPETTITTPKLSHTGPGTITALNSFASTNSNAKFTININQSGNYLYWNGANWAISNGTYAQSTDASMFNANVESLPILGAYYGQFKVHFPNQNTQGSITSLTANTQESSYHLSGWVKTSGGISISSLTSLTETVTKPTNTNIQYVIELNGSPRYWNGSSWATSDLSFAQSNSIASLTSNLSTLTPTNSTAKFYAILNTTDEKVTPSIDTLEVVSDFGGVVSDIPETCVVYGYIKDLGANPISGVTVTVQLSEDATEYREAASNLTSNKLVTTSDVNGYWSFSLIKSSEFEGSGTYKISFLKSGVLNIKTNGGNPITFQVPDQTSVDLSSIIGDV